MESIPPANHMAGPCSCRNPFPLAGKDKLARKAPTDDSGILAVFCAPIPTPPQAPTPTLGPTCRYTDEDLQKATKLALESFIQG